jgi:hypothetical protein
VYYHYRCISSLKFSEDFSNSLGRTVNDVSVPLGKAENASKICRMPNVHELLNFKISLSSSQKQNLCRIIFYKVIQSNNEIRDATNITFAPIMWIKKNYFNFIKDKVNMPDITFVKFNQNHYVE